jgi:hypothetical protein
VNPTFRDEVQFLAWGDGPQGPWIKLKLPDSDDLAPFRGMTAAKATQAGQRMACVLVEIGDDEKAVPNRSDTKTSADDSKLKGGELARLSGILCNQPDFQAWLRDTFPSAWVEVSTEAPGTDVDSDITARMVRRICAVNSRAELDHNALAADTFHQRIRLPWLEFSK